LSHRLPLANTALDFLITVADTTTSPADDSHAQFARGVRSRRVSLGSDHGQQYPATRRPVGLA